jgi:SAM-dependent methyltransferase
VTEVATTAPHASGRRAWLARLYSADAATYDEEWSPVIRPAGEALIAALRLAGARRVLDVGAGAGALTDTIRRAAPAAGVIGIDASAGMLAVARHRRGLAGAVADAMCLPVPDRSVDAVVLAYVLFHLTDPLAALAEAARALRPRGQVGTVTWADEQSTVAAEAWNRALDDAGAPPAPPRSDDRGLDSPARMEELLRRAGLRPVRAFTETIDYTFASEQFFRLRLGFGTTRWRLDRLEARAREQVVARLRGEATRWSPEQLRFRGEVVLAVGSRP